MINKHGPQEYIIYAYKYIERAYVYIYIYI